MSQTVFWQRKTLQEMTPEEWESLCDGCGKCCLHKLEDEDTGEVHFTDIACQYLDAEACQCSVYSTRQQNVPDCVVLRPEDVEIFEWLPSTCAYRLIGQGEPLYDGHPLISGDPNSVHAAGMSVAGKVYSEADIPEQDWEEHIVRWVF